MWQTRTANRAKNISLALLQAQLPAFVPLMQYNTGYAANLGGKQSKKPDLTLLQAQLRAFKPLMQKYSTGYVANQN